VPTITLLAGVAHPPLFSDQGGEGILLLTGPARPHLHRHPALTPPSPPTTEPPPDLRHDLLRFGLGDLDQFLAGLAMPPCLAKPLGFSRVQPDISRA